jgi:hypothetical protein
MRRTLRELVIVIPLFATACSLYIGPDPGDDEPPPAGECDAVIATCEDGVVTFSEWPGTDSCPRYRTPQAVLTCAGECTSDYLGLCVDQGCLGPEEMCMDPPAEPLPPVLSCDTTASCEADSTSTCGGLDLCGVDVRVGDCRCDGGVQTCEPACADGLCSADEVQAALVGTWTGTVESEWGTYTTTLTFRPDGHYYSVRPGPEGAFYYGTDGGGDARRFHVIGQTDHGATAVVRVYFFSESVQDGLVRDIRIVEDRVRFELVDAWLGCDRSFYFDLARQ